MKVFSGVLKWSTLILYPIIFLGIIFIVSINGWVLWRGNRYIIATTENIPPGSVGVVFGTSPRSGKGHAANPFFEGRMNTAAALYQSGAVYHLVLSGDNHHADYNEPYAMRDALHLRGIPPSALTLDYAGFRTLDTVTRAHRVFEIQHPILITDDFHMARALFLAEAEGIAASGVISSSVPWRRSYKTRIREWGSRVRAWLDIYILKTQPHFLGKTIQLPKPFSPDAPEPTLPPKPAEVSDDPSVSYSR